MYRCASILLTSLPLFSLLFVAWVSCSSFSNFFISFCFCKKTKVQDHNSITELLLHARRARSFRSPPNRVLPFDILRFGDVLQEVLNI